MFSSNQLAASEGGKLLFAAFVLCILSFIGGIVAGAWQSFTAKPVCEPACLWPAKVPAKDLQGNTIEICVYPEVLADGGFVINVHREGDKKTGRCWGTVIYPEPVTDQSK